MFQNYKKWILEKGQKTQDALVSKVDKYTSKSK